MKRKSKWKRPGTFEDPEAIEPELRTKPHEEYDEGILTIFEPVTVLRSDSFALAAEIVRTRICWGGYDWTTSYRIRLVGWGPAAKGRTGLDVEYTPGQPHDDTYGLLRVLLEDAAAYIEQLEREQQG